jgi:flagellar hook assembly protein FlgD
MANYMEYLTGLASVVEVPKPINIGETNFKIFPNPFVTTINIQWNSNLPLKTNIKIYDQSGRVIKWLLKSQNTSKGSEVRWDGKDNNGKVINPGIYFVRVTSGTTTITKTITKTK